MRNSLKSLLILPAFLLAALSPCQGQDKPLTAAESSNYEATSSYAEVTAFLAALQKLSPFIRVESLAVSAEGRDIPLAVIGRPLPLAPVSLKNDKRIVVYFQANIHAGEVEGKEAVLMLARDILLDPKPPYLDNVVLLIAPVFNPDGNEKVSPQNRPGQLGPARGVGVRHNGQNLDLNRDAMKLESPELQGLVRNVLMRWDPVLLLDAHTTDGSYHEEPVTYSWPLCPNGDAALLAYARDKMMPAVKEAMEKKYGTLAIPYGDPVDFRDMEKGWRTFGHEPRYVTNYIGLRNRFSILDENYNYADFKTRVSGCYALLRAVLDYCDRHAAELTRLTAEADRRAVERGLNPAAGPGFGLDIEVKELGGKVTVRGYEMEVTQPEGAPFPRMKRTDRKKTYVLPYFADFVPKRTVRYPLAYLVPLFDDTVLDKLLGHGLTVERLAEPVSLAVEAFRIKDLKAGERLFQGHHLNKVSGEYAEETRQFPAGTLVVRTAQPLGGLAAYLLEPESDDGLLVWNFFDRHIVGQWGRGYQTYPVYKLHTPANLVLGPAR